ncbi:MAG: hypothetical protein ABIU10_03540 [Sphingomicrobium sp.]
MIGGLLWLAAGAAATVHSPGVEAHLASLVGDWTRVGKETTYRDHCVWFDRRAFVVCSLSDKASGLRVEAIVGYSKDDERYTYESYSNEGKSHVQYGFALGANGIVFTDESNVNATPMRLTTSIMPEPDGRLHMTQDRSVRGGPWQQVGEVYYVPRK